VQQNYLKFILVRHLGLITHREIQLRNELSEAATKGAENRQTSDGMYETTYYVTLFLLPVFLIMK